MEFIRIEKGLKITIDDIDKRFLAEILVDRAYDPKTNDVIGSDVVMYDFFDPFICNSEFEWIRPEDIGALTSAPILGCLGENDEVVEAYGYMNYAVQSLMQDLYDTGETFFQKG